METIETKKSEKLNGKHNAEKTHNKQFNSAKTDLVWESEDSASYKVLNTPFHIVKNQNEWYVVIGKYRVSEGFTNGQEALEDAQRQDWDRVMQIIQLMIEENKKL